MLQIRGELGAPLHARIENVDLVISACGFESRSRAFAERFAFAGARRLAFAFDRQQVLSFDQNAKTFSDKGYSLIQLPDRDLLPELLSQLERLQQAMSGETSVFVDISSQTRGRIASVVEAVAVAGERAPVRTFFGYSPARFTPPPSNQAPVVNIGPVSPFFAGWAKDPDLPVSMILGLGYEPDRAMGAMEYLEPANVWAFMPRSTERQFDASLREANAQLIDQIGPARVVTYQVEDPNATLALLSSIVSHLSQTSSVLMLPSGPKILALQSLLLAYEDTDRSVWRVSAGVNDMPVDREPTGRSVIVECLFSPQENSLIHSGESAGPSAEWLPDVSRVPSIELS